MALKARPKAVVAAGSGTAGELVRRRQRRAVVAMSGGVDSSVAAALLVERGFDVTGIMLKLWRGEAANLDSGCCNVGAAADARRVADTLGIPFYVLNFAERFEDTVIANFHADYTAGRTPNPCVRCNQWIKFDALLDRAGVLGADVLATGHYARVTERDGAYRLMRGVDPNKDQSYVLWMLDQPKLARALFPVGDMPKTETRRIAAELGLRTAAKPDSQEICFVKNGDLGSYVDDHIPTAAHPGPIMTTDGEQVGEHRGVARYTVGQRKGLGISLGTPLFVRSIDAPSNTIVVGGRDELGCERFVAEETSYVADALGEGRRVLVQYRSHGDAHTATVTARDAGRLAVAFDRPVDAVARGQSAAFYDPDRPDELLGGGVISSTVAAGARV